jgi:hypothetical protein
MKSIFLLPALLLLASCANIAQQRQQQYAVESKAIFESCEQERVNGVYKTYSEALEKCETPKNLVAAEKYSIPNQDLLAMFYNKKSILAKKVDSKKLSKDEAAEELDKYYLELSNIESQRNAQIIQQQQQSQMQSQMFWQGLNNVYQNQMQYQQMNTPPTPVHTNCSRSPWGYDCTTY